MRTILLSNGMVTKIDDSDFESLSRFNWVALRSGKNTYARRAGKPQNILMHREILGVIDRTFVVDHEDRDTLNNQRSNLRVCNKSLNAAAGVFPPPRASKMRGVYLDRRDNCWFAAITVNYRMINLGRFKEVIDAAKAYNKAAMRYFGEFARLNKV